MPTKAVRFSDEEDKAIKEFLKNNPFLDFSTLTRLALSKFLESPELQLKPNKKNNRQEKRIH